MNGYDPDSTIDALLSKGRRIFVDGEDTSLLEEARPPEFSDEALALRFAAEHDGNLRFVDPWGKWLVWDGWRWRLDDTLAALDFVRRTCREVAAECKQRSIAKAIASGKTVASVERLARADRRLAATTYQWDANPWLLNTPEGVIDLPTGQKRPHDRSDYITRTTTVSPGGTCPLFQSFLARITDDDSELQRYLQSVCGYALTGKTSEHALFFCYGTGANGKSVLLSTIAGIMGPYHRTAPIETFTASKGERHPTDLAGLRGARLVTATETEEGRPWAESRLKTLTGGDSVAARFMRQDYFEFTPVFKLVIAGNHKPALRHIDEAIKRRFHLIPFNVTIPPEERDKNLAEKLKSEWPGILAWMIEGCLKWKVDGLNPPVAVTKATAAYLEAEDALSAWIDECCIRDPAAWSSSSELFASWNVWAKATGEPPGSMKRFVANLEARGFTSQRRTKARGFEGLIVTQRETLWAQQ